MAKPTQIDQPAVPEGYGLPSNSEHLLSWTAVDNQLAKSLHYWMSTTRPDGRPHVIPRWGAWIDGALYYDGSPETIHARNLSSNQACSMHIGSGADAIIAEGLAVPSSPISGKPGSLGEAVAREIANKYSNLGYEPSPDAWSGPDAGGLVVFTPVKIMAWSNFPVDLTRFHFGPS